MKFVDRTNEISRLQEALAKETASLVVLYGRRRLGKSTLIKRVLTDRDIYFLADRSEGTHQRELLAKVIAQVFPDFDKATYHDWESLLRALNYRATQRFTLCLDELPYIVEQSPELPSVLQKLIDEKSLNYHIAVCGSSQNMMYGLFLDATAPLYGRAETIFRLAPISPTYLPEALGVTPAEAIEEYAVWGGVPRYWELREGIPTLHDALFRHVFSTYGTLYEEPAKLFVDDVKDIVKTATIMSYIGSGANRLSEIASRCNEQSTNLSRPLRKLIDLGFLERETPFGTEEQNAKKSLYKIADPFLSFYYRFVVPHRSFIELNRMQTIEHAINQQFTSYVGMHWERLCRDAVTGNTYQGILYGQAKRWWGALTDAAKTPAEIDVVAESIDRRFLLVGECKWTKQEDAERLTDELRRKAELLPFAKQHTIVPVLFLKHPPLHDQGNTILPQDVLQWLQ